MEHSLFAFEPAKPAGHMHPLALAYLGDAIYEMYIRQYMLSQPNHRPQHLHKQSTGYVSAKAQARLLAEWLPLLTEEELGIVKLGRNAKSGRAPKSADVLDYRHSTGFECLIGYLYYERRHERLKQLLDMATGEIGGL